MRGLLLIAASVVPLMTYVADDAAAQQRFGGRGIHGGGFHGGGGFRGGGFGGGGFRHGALGPGRWGGGFRGAVRPGFGPGRIGFGGGYRYPRAYYGYGRRGISPYYGAVTGLAIGALASGYPYGYDYPYSYAYPYSYPYSAPVPYAYPVRRAYATGPIGGYCATPVKTCQLINPSVIGGGCSCRVAGGRARGEVVGP